MDPSRAPEPLWGFVEAAKGLSVGMFHRGENNHTVVLYIFVLFVKQSGRIEGYGPVSNTIRTKPTWEVYRHFVIRYLHLDFVRPYGAAVETSSQGLTPLMHVLLNCCLDTRRFYCAFMDAYSNRSRIATIRPAINRETSTSRVLMAQIVDSVGLRLLLFAMGGLSRSS